MYIMYIIIRMNIYMIYLFIGGICGFMVSVVENGHDNSSSNPGQCCLHSTSYKYPWDRYESNYSPSVGK